MTQQSLTLDELLDQLRVALVRQHRRSRRRVVYTLAIFAAGVAATVALGATYGHWLSSYTQDVNFAGCMRSNGVPNFRDPSSNNGPVLANQIDPNSSVFVAAYKACQKDAPSGQPGPPAPTAAQLRFALTFARCIRNHGFPQFPNPLTTYGPGFTLGQGMYFTDNGTYQVTSPAFMQAAKACGVQLPSGPP